MTQELKPTTISQITGIDNVSDETQLRKGGMRELVNVDLTAKGMPKRRGGFQLSLAATAAHSLTQWTGGMLAVLDGVLSAFDDGMTATAIHAGLSDTPLGYAELAGDVYWSNEAVFRRVRGLDLGDTEGWPDCLGQPVVSPIVGVGGLGAGTYQVAITCMDADGRESGASQAELVDVAEGGGIGIVSFPATAGGVTFRVYVSPPNGDLLEHALDVPVGASNVGIGAGTRGKALETQFLVPLPPGHMLTKLGGRLLMASGDTVFIGEAHRYGLCNPDRAFGLRERVTLLQGCGDAENVGCFVSGSKRTLYFAGPDPVSGARRVVYPHGAVEGSGLTVEGNLLGLETTQPVAVWLATNGVFCAGLPGGQVLPLTEGQCALPTAERAAALLRKRNGVLQILMAMQGQRIENPFAIGDSAVATVRRNGVEI